MSTTADHLLATLQQETGVPTLRFAAPPESLTGGFYAEMLGFRLADAPPELTGDLVARIVPHAPAGAWEAVIQRGVARQGFPTPAVRLVAPDSGPLGRYLIVMDRVDGRPPLDGLRATTVVAQAPGLIRRLPGQLAAMAAALHQVDPDPIAAALDALDSDIPTTTAGFVASLAFAAADADRPDLVAAAERLLATEPASPVRVVAHGDLHPFNLLLTDAGPQLIDWTVARVAHPGFTVAFTDLMLSHPPIAVPRALVPGRDALGRSLSRRFREAYAAVAPERVRVDEAELEWHRRVHALRILVELASWQAAGRPPGAGHPWLVLEGIVGELVATA